MSDIQRFGRNKEDAEMVEHILFNIDGKKSQLNSKEYEFVTSIRKQSETWMMSGYSKGPSPRQVAWLIDIKNRLSS